MTQDLMRAPLMRAALEKAREYLDNLAASDRQHPQAEKLVDEIDAALSTPPAPTGLTPTGALSCLRPLTTPTTAAQDQVRAVEMENEYLRAALNNTVATLNDRDDEYTSAREDEIIFLKRKIEGLETLRPVWAHEVDPQITSVALASVWKILGVDNQTAAMQKLEKLRALKSSPAPRIDEKEMRLELLRVAERRYGRDNASVNDFANGQDDVLDLCDIDILAFGRAIQGRLLGGKS